MLFDDANYRKEKHPSNNWDIFGADTAVETLRTHIASGLINRSYMFIGPSGIGKSRLAVRFAQSVFAPLADDPTSPDLNHETAHRIEAGEFGDIHFIAASEDSKTGRSKAPDIRQFIHSADLKPFNSKHRFVIFEADIASDAGRSATLKFLEEPPSDTTLIIITDSPSGFPATIRSRCYEIVLRPLPQETLAAILVSEDLVEDIDIASEYALLAEGCYGKAVSLINDPSFMMTLKVIMDDVEKYSLAVLEDRLEYSDSLSKAWRNDRDTVLETIGYWERWWHDALLLTTGATENNIWHIPRAEESNLDADMAVRALTAIQSARENLLENVNPRLSIDQMMIDIPQLVINR